MAVTAAQGPFSTQTSLASFTAGVVTGLSAHRYKSGDAISAGVQLNTGQSFKSATSCPASMRSIILELLCRDFSQHFGLFDVGFV